MKFRYRVIAFNEPHRLMIMQDPNRVYAIVGVRFNGKGENHLISESTSFTTIFERFTSWVGDNYVIY